MKPLFAIIILCWISSFSKAEDVALATVTISGGVERPGVYPKTEATTIFTLLAASGDAVVGADPERTRIIRHSGQKNEITWIVDLYKLIAKRKDIRLEQGDIVNIPSCVMMGGGGLWGESMKSWKDSMTEFEKARKESKLNVFRLKTK